MMRRTIVFALGLWSGCAIVTIRDGERRVDIHTLGSAKVAIMKEGEVRVVGASLSEAGGMVLSGAIAGVAGAFAP